MSPDHLPRHQAAEQPFADRPAVPHPRSAMPPARVSAWQRVVDTAPPPEADTAPRQRGPLRLRIVLALVLVIIVGAALRFIPGSPLAPANAAGNHPDTAPVATTAAPQTPATPAPTTSTAPKLAPLPFQSTKVSVKTTGFWSWALLDRRTGRIVGSSNYAAQSTTASMIKAWLASDYLRNAAAKGTTPSTATLHTIEIMIRDSDNDAGQTIYQANGGTASIRRLISMCKLTDSTAVPGEWGTTRVSARDTVRMADCIGSGRAAGAKWTPWVLDMMRKVRGVGDFGIRDALPDAAAAIVAIKNGWLLRDEDHNWHVSCMAIGDTWTMSVLQRYPSTGHWDTDFAHARDVCRQVAAQLLSAAKH